MRMLITIGCIVTMLWVNGIRTLQEFLALVCLEGLIWILMKNLY